MTVQLVSSNLTKKGTALVTGISCNPKIGEFIFLGGHFRPLTDPLRGAGAILFDVVNKLVLLAACKDQDPKNILIPNLWVKISPRMTPGIALAAEALRRGMSTEKCGLYVEQFPQWKEAPFLAHIGLKMLLFREGYTDKTTTDIFESSNVKVLRVDL